MRDENAMLDTDLWLRLLVLDVNTHRYPHSWVPVDAMWEGDLECRLFDASLFHVAAMARKTNVGKPRGYLQVSLLNKK